MSIQADGASREKTTAASVSLGTNFILTTVKAVGAFLTGSVGLFSEAVHSGADLVGSTLVLVSVRVAAAPPDDEHPYGHAKVENIAGLAEAGVLGLLGLFVIGQGIEHLWHGVTLQRIDLGLLVAIGCALMSGAAGYYIRRVGLRTQSAALQANGLHLLSDLGTSAGVALAFALVKLAGIHWADGVIGIVLGAWLVVSSFRVGHEAFQQLIDRRLPDVDVARIREVIGGEPSLISYHRLRTRLSGNVRYIDCHVVVPNTWSVVEAHQVVDKLEIELREELKPAVVVIHVDPYDEEKARR
ncbi:MAG TPA: cation diffusion facilitator family transporter [Fimbriimonadaceae bacterium]|nr:cation diffusion facilitator family transporter [Fimbriimonadaceae bacterium]